MNTYYHITSEASLAGIHERGLLPMLGDRTRRVSSCIQFPCTHVCETKEDARYLSKLSMWKTHPDFEYGRQILLEVKSTEQGVPDLVFNFGGYRILKQPTTHNIRVMEAAL